MKKYTQKETITTLHGGDEGLEHLSSITGIHGNTLRQYRRGARMMSAPVNLLFRLLLLAKKRGTMEDDLSKASNIEISGK